MEIGNRIMLELGLNEIHHEINNQLSQYLNTEKLMFYGLKNNIWLTIKVIVDISNLNKK